MIDYSDILVDTMEYVDDKLTKLNPESVNSKRVR